MRAKNREVLVTALLLAFGAVLAGRSAVAAQTSPATDKEHAANEIKLGAAALRERKYSEAQQHYQEALKLDPGQTTAWALLGRSIRAQYKPGAKDARNLAKANEAIAAYEKALELDPNQDEAFASIVQLCRTTGDTPKERNWLLKRAHSQLAKVKRALAYRRLAELDASCAKDRARTSVEEADRCAAEGLDAADQAIALGADEEPVLTTKAQLLRERGTLARASTKPGNARVYDEQAAAVDQRIAQLREQAREKSESLPTY